MSIAAKNRNRRPVSEETKRKISEANTGAVRSAEHREAVRKAQTGRKHTPEHIAKVVARLTGRVRTKEQNEKMVATRRANKTKNSHSFSPVGA